MNTLTAQLYPSLLRHAALLLAGHTATAALQPADLLHMAVERLCTHPPAEIREHPAEFTGLLRTIMQRTLINEFRKARAARRPDLRNAVLLDEAGDIPANGAASGDAAAVHEALAILAASDPAAAALIRGHFLEGHTGVELGTRLGLSRATISRRLSLALTALRGIYEAGD